MGKPPHPPSDDPKPLDPAASGDGGGGGDAHAGGPAHGEHRLPTAMTEDGFEVPAPMAQVRSDVDRISQFFHSIHSRYVWAGIVLLLVTALVGTIVAVTTPMRDWYMHTAMYAVLFTFVMFYLRAHQLHRRLARAVYALIAVALTGFFMWVLLDLVAPRLEVVEGEILRGTGETVIGPIVAERPEAGGLIVAVVLLGLVGLWLLFHWLVVTRYHKDDGEVL
ncbi:MAG: hypothetical protein EP329_22810 [Deltaproteobacteria bacterium]|nr:MAG: hypothetical protein EP329_22810 [Deltaproteobacteria bacterium]